MRTHCFRLHRGDDLRGAMEDYVRAHHIRAAVVLSAVGCVRGTGPIEIGQHIHNELAQWYFPLPGSEFIYTAGGEEVKMTGGDLSFTPTGFWHGSKVEAGRQCDYIWFEMCIDGYPGEIK